MNERPTKTEADQWTTEGARRFIEYLQRNSAHVLRQAETMRNKPQVVEVDVPLGIYLDVAIKEHVLGIDPYGGISLDEEGWLDRRAVAYVITEEVSRLWLQRHPDSSPAKAVVAESIFSSKQDQIALLQEMWPFIASRFPESNPR